MGTDKSKRPWLSFRNLVMAAAVFLFAGCGTGPLVGIAYTHVKLPLTRNVRPTPVPENTPKQGSVVQIKEPVTGFGFYAKVNSNAIGDIAEKNNMKQLYFADQEIFSILGIFTSQKVHLYGE